MSYIGFPTGCMPTVERSDLVLGCSRGRSCPEKRGIEFRNVIDRLSYMRLRTNHSLRTGLAPCL